MGLKKPVKRPPLKSGAATKPLRAKRDDFEVEAKHAVTKGGSFDRVGRERKKQELNVNKPWNVMVPIGGKLTVYVLDEGEPFATYQHVIGASAGQRGKDVPCIQDGPEPCPVCLSTGKTGTFVMYLTAVIPREQYTKKGEARPTVRMYQKKLLQIKLKMADTWRRIYEEHGTFRGLVLELHRDNKLDPSSGNQVRVIRKLTEKQIKKYAQALDVADKDAREYIVKSKIDEVFDYEKIFPTPDAKTLSQIAGIGSSTTGLRMIGAEDSDDDGVVSSGSEWGED